MWLPGRREAPSGPGPLAHSQLLSQEGQRRGSGHPAWELPLASPLPLGRQQAGLTPHGTLPPAWSIRGSALGCWVSHRVLQGHPRRQTTSLTVPTGPHFSRICRTSKQSFSASAPLTFGAGSSAALCRLLSKTWGLCPLVLLAPPTFRGSR